MVVWVVRGDEHQQKCHILQSFGTRIAVPVAGPIKAFKKHQEAEPNTKAGDGDDEETMELDGTRLTTNKRRTSKD